MPNSIDFYKRIFLHVIPAVIIVPFCYWYCGFICNFFILSFYNLWHILCTAGTDLNDVTIEGFMKLFAGGKCVSISWIKFLAMFVLMRKLNGWLDQTIFHLLVLVLFCSKSGCMYWSVALRPHVFSASS